MSNILIIKHGALGDVVQISGVLKDIRNAHKEDKITILTTHLYAPLFLNSAFVDDVIIDRRETFLKLGNLFNLCRVIRKKNFKKVYDLQNSSRTRIYRKYLFGIKNWSSTETILLKDETKLKFDKKSILKRFEIQLSRSSVQTKFTSTPDFSWAVDQNFQLDSRIKKKYIYLAPFASKNGAAKIWPYFTDLVKLIKTHLPEFDVVVTPGPSEIEEAKNMGAIVQLDGVKATSISQMAKVIQDADFVVSNDTGPAHMSAHLGRRGLVLFGPHITPQTMSIETKDFKAISVKDLHELKPDVVFKKMEEMLQDYSMV